MLTCQVEGWSDVRCELQPIFEEHYDALSEYRARGIPLALDHAKYALCEREGSLLLVTLREDGDLAGYCSVFVFKSMHYGTLQASPDLLYVRKETRSRAFAVYRRLLRSTERELRRRGVVCWCQSVTQGGERMLTALGFERPNERYMVKWIS